MLKWAWLLGVGGVSDSLCLVEIEPFTGIQTPPILKPCSAERATLGYI